jgi:dUTP pyrophosphatase
MKQIKIDVMNESLNKLPRYETEYSAGLDVRAYLEESIIIQPLSHKLIKTGLKVAIPEGYEIQVRPRSGLAFKEGVTVLNTPGTIDSDYRGDIGVILYNTSDDEFIVNPGDRIAQLILAPIVQIQWEPVTELPETVRGEGGFGHTGKE